MNDLKCALVSFSSNTVFSNKPKWADLELWKDDPPSWSSCNAHLKLSKQERKKQDLIYGTICLAFMFILIVYWS